MAEVPCGLCDTHCDEDTECVHCSGCDKWHHMKCVPMTSSQLAYGLMLTYTFCVEIAVLQKTSMTRRSHYRGEVIFISKLCHMIYVRQS